MNRYDEEMFNADMEGEADADARAEADDKAREEQGRAEAEEWDALTPAEKEERLAKGAHAQPGELPF